MSTAGRSVLAVPLGFKCPNASKSIPAFMFGDLIISLCQPKKFIMKSKTLAVLTIGCAAILYLSCYKTGEVIYQTECKPDSLTVSIPMYNFIKFFTLTPFYGSLTYDANRRLTGATTIKGGAPQEQYDFIYDGNNNLIRINGSAYGYLNALTLNLYITFSYPAGTAASLSSTAQVQVHLLDPNDLTWVTGPAWTYNFNTEFQLVSIFQGAQLVEQLTYDNGGDCLADSEYANNVVNRYFTYPAYDNKINPARSDRSIQLFLQMYSKNNPTISNEYASNFAGTDAFVLLYSSSGSYTYNADNYPITYAGNFFAHYNCIPMPNPVIAPGPAGK
jgi:hypothetical protein